MSTQAWPLHSAYGVFQKLGFKIYATEGTAKFYEKAAIKYKVPYITTLAGAYNTVKGISAAKAGHGEVKSLQEYHASIEEI